MADEKDKSLMHKIVNDMSKYANGFIHAAAVTTAVIVDGKERMEIKTSIEEEVDLLINPLRDILISESKKLLVEKREFDRKVASGELDVDALMEQKKGSILDDILKVVKPSGFWH